MCVFYLVRHGKTEYNTVNRMQGWNDSPLLPEGISLARKVGNGLAGIEFAKAYTSPVGRSKDTAKVVLGERDIELVDDEAFRECHFGSLEGETFHRSEGSTIIDLFKKGYHEYGGEDYDDLMKRVKDKMLLIAKQYPDDNVLIFTHGGVVACLGYSLMNEEDRKQIIWAPRNCSVAIIECKEGRFMLLDYDNIDYQQ